MADLKIKIVKNLGSFLAHLLHRRLVPVIMLKKIDFRLLFYKFTRFLTTLLVVKSIKTGFIIERNDFGSYQFVIIIRVRL